MRLSRLCLSNGVIVFPMIVMVVPFLGYSYMIANEVFALEDT